MLSGAPLLLLIVVGWAAVLVPMLLHRHDASVESRSADRFATAMRILSRRSAPTTDRRYIVVPRPPAPAPRRTAVGGGGHGRSAPAPTAHPAGRAQVAVRRRRVLLGLLLVAIGGLIGGLVAAPWWWAVQAAADVLVLAFVVHLRREAVRARARDRSRRRPAAGPPLAAPIARSEPTARPSVPAPAGAAPSVAPTSITAGVTPGRTVEVTTYTRSEGWQPVPVPVPTYVTAPRAPAPERPETAPAAADEARPTQPRIVDLTRPGAWSAAELGIDLTDGDDLLDVELAAGEDHALDDILERRRAVND